MTQMLPRDDPGEALEVFMFQVLSFFNYLLEAVVTTDIFEWFMGISAVCCILGIVYNRLL